jgi:hypothetical protein
MSETNTSPGTESAFPILDPVEARVLGCLIEKAALTPDAYPLTTNAAVVACNQKTSREPVMELEPGAVGHALRRLEDKRLVGVVHGARALRYEHRADGVYVITQPQRALLCLLLLRGPQTLAELYTRSERLASFAGPDDLRATVERLCERTPPLVVRLPRGAGQREERYMHLLSGPVDVAALGTTIAATTERAAADDDRLARLEARVDALERALDALRQRREGT